ncbi:hypothetical protein ACUXK4_002882 [Methylorubrum extorquens]
MMRVRPLLRQAAYSWVDYNSLFILSRSVTSGHYRAGLFLFQFGNVQLLETNVPTLRLNTRRIALATLTAVLTLSAAACATKPPPAPVEPAPLIKKG